MLTVAISRSLFEQFKENLTAASRGGGDIKNVKAAKRAEGQAARQVQKVARREEARQVAAKEVAKKELERKEAARAAATKEAARREAEKREAKQQALPKEAEKRKAKKRANAPWHTSRVRREFASFAVQAMALLAQMAALSPSAIADALGTADGNLQHAAHVLFGAAPV